MDYKVRQLKKDEDKILEVFLYEAIFIPERVEPPPKDIINHPDLYIYFRFW
jgi:acetyltransferase, GNAT family